VGVLVVDTDIAWLIWRDALPDELDRQLLGQISLITFGKHFEPLEPLGLDLL
jgi:hypothetical protein